VLRTIHHLPLLVQPAARRVVPALQHHVVALQAAGEVVPGRGDHGVFALQVLDGLFGGGLERVGWSASNSSHMKGGSGQGHIRKGRDVNFRIRHSTPGTPWTRILEMEMIDIGEMEHTL
jgi:hypothetical protein